jgi:hypothetical protein
MTAADYLKRFPHARPSTIAYLVERDRVNAQLRREVRQMRPAPRPRPWWAFWRAA